MPNTAGILECEEIDTIFAEAEQAVTKNLIRKKIVQQNAYWGTGKVPDGGMFPLGSGTRIKGYRLGRIGVPNCTGWRPITDELCSTNACSFEPDVIQHGHDDYFFSLVEKDLRTDWLCIDSLALRAMATDEIMHLEEGLQDATRYVHEEFRRSRYLLFGRNKIIAISADAGGGVPVANQLACAPNIVQNAYLFEVRDNGEMDECNVRVRVDNAQIRRLSELSLDLLDFAKQRLIYQGEGIYLSNTNLLDVLLCEPRVANRLALQEDDNLNNAQSQGGFNMLDLQQTFGTERVIRNYSLRTDLHAMRFYPDTAFNDALAAFDTDDPNTWPRFNRVFPYVPVAADGAGVKFVTNDGYLDAPFGISTILHSRVMEVMSFPRVQNVAGAQKVGGFGYEGTAQWQNPDWPCNPNRDKGFWKMRFRLAAKQNRDDEGYSWFHRIDQRRQLIGNVCAIPVAPCNPEVTAYCFEGLVDDPGENRAIDESALIPS